MIVQDLRETSSRLDKEAILRKAEPLDLKMFNYAYDKNKVYGLKFDMAEPQVCLSPKPEDFELLDKLRTRQLTGDAARQAVYQHCITYGAMVKLVCNKDLDCGVTATLVNKVHPGTVPVFKVQLAKEQPLHKVVLPCWSEIKYDGVRLVVRKEGDEVTFTTRNGKLVALPRLGAKLAALWDCNCDGILDTEATLETGQMADRTKISGLITSAMRGGTVDEASIVLNVFDIMSLREFDTQNCPHTYARRRYSVEQAVKVINSEQVRIAEAVRCDSLEAISERYAQVLSQGYEGLILKHDSSMYLFKRTPAWTKMKETRTADLKCVEVLEGEGKYVGQIGALRLEGMVEGKWVEVKVGSGLTDTDRSLPDAEYLGMTIEAKYNSLTQDSHTGQWSLFLPRFVCVRTDR